MTDDPKQYNLQAETGSFKLTGNAVSATLWDAAVTKMKRIRETLGFTHQNQIANVAAWHSLAKSFHCAAQVLNEFGDRIPSDTRPFAFNAAQSLELIFKAILAKKQLPIPNAQGGHDLLALCAAANVKISQHQKVTLELMTEEIIWAGRYPAPKAEHRWNDYNDRILEKHIVRSQIGNVSSARANPDTFPNLQNYEKIWQISVAELELTNSG